jgi:hypothetical protein
MGADRLDEWRIHGRSGSDRGAAVVETSEAELEPVQRLHGTFGRPGLPPRRELGPQDSAQQCGVVEDWTRNGPSYASKLRSGRVRPERLFVALAAFFLVMAVAKPWGDVIAPEPTAATDSSLMIASRPPSYAVTVMTSVPGWTVVDWALLSRPDAHTSWGIAWAIVPDQVVASASLAPRISWVATYASQAPVDVAVGSDQRIFGLAVTWPATFRATSLRFEYLGSDRALPSPASSGYAARESITPLRAELVTTPMPLTAGRNKRPVAVPQPLRSGDFLVAPYQQPQGAYTVSLSTSWYGEPWAWPVGEYWVEVDSAVGQKVLRLNLVAQGG